MKQLNFKYKILLGLIPYFAVLIGLYLFSNAFLTIILYHVLAIIAIIVFKKKYLIDYKIFQGWNNILGTITILFGLVSGIIIYYLWDIVTKTGLDLQSQLSLFGLSGSVWIFFIIYLIIINPIVEEIFWRGFLSENNKKSIIFDILFAGYHVLVIIFFIKVIWVMVAFLLLVVAGFLWRKIRFNKGLMVPYLSHIVADASIILFTHLIRGGG